MQEKIKLLEKKLQDLDMERSVLQDAIKKAYAELSEVNELTKNSSNLSPEEKIYIFMSLFKGRQDVFPKRWENNKTNKSGYSPACFNEWVKGKCNKPKIKCSDCTQQAFIPLTVPVLYKHLGGESIQGIRRDHTVGIYPMLLDDTCWFLAIDLDKKDWQRDAKALIQTCEKKSIPFALERSRSGNGAHIWIFFDKPISASIARKMGAALMTETMEHCPEIGFESYDRFFPNQDTLPSGGFGNLIALPLQYLPRGQGNSIFLDNNFNPYSDQWRFLSTLSKMSEHAVNCIVEQALNSGKILGVRMPTEEDGQNPWEMTPSRKPIDFSNDLVLPKSVRIVISNQLYVESKIFPLN